MNKTKEDALKTREQILSAAQAELTKKGYAGTTLSDIVKTAGLTRGALYWHFKDKEQLYIAVVNNVLKGMAERKEKIAADRQFSAVERIVRLLMMPITETGDFRLVNDSIELIQHEPGLYELSENITNARHHLIVILKGILKDAGYSDEDTLSRAVYYIFEGLYFDARMDSGIDEGLIRSIVKSILKK